MSYVYEFRRFLDTAAIREHNRNICFVPSEQAILICASQKASILDKIKALKYLLETYTEDEFCVEQLAGSEVLERYGVTFRQVVQYKIEIWEKVLKSRYDNNGVVYAAFFDERGFVRDTISSAHFFSDYYRAYSYLQKEKLSYSEGYNYQ